MSPTEKTYSHYTHGYNLKKKKNSNILWELPAMPHEWGWWLYVPSDGGELWGILAPPWVFLGAYK